MSCDCGTDDKKSFWQSKPFLGIVTAFAVVLISFPYYAEAFYPKQQEPKVASADKANVKQVIFKIKGMSCESCTHHVNSEISKVKGIIAFQTSYKNANSTIKFDNSKTSVDSLAAAINRTGYKVISKTVSTN